MAALRHAVITANMITVITRRSEMAGQCVHIFFRKNARDIAQNARKNAPA